MKKIKNLIQNTDQKREQALTWISLNFKVKNKWSVFQSR